MGIREGRKRKLAVDRFPTPDFSAEYVHGGMKEAIQFRVDWEAPTASVLPDVRPEGHAAAWCPLYLTGVGLYGPVRAGYILRVRLSLLVANSETVLSSFDKEVVSQGLGKVVEVDLPVAVRLQPD